MSPFLERKELFDQVLRLKEEEKRDPFIVLERFFGDYRLHECRHYLWTMVETCLTTDSAEFSDPEERANLLLGTGTWRACWRPVTCCCCNGTLLKRKKDHDGKSK